MKQIIIELPEHHQGDSWDGIPAIGPFTINGVAPASPLVGIRLYLVREGKGAPVIKLGTGEGVDAPIVIHNAATWFASVPRISYEVFNPVVGTYWGDLEFTAADGWRKSPYRVKLPVTPDLTHD